MPFEADNEILQDFLIEAGEILEKLGEQLVELEHSPTDRELLNAVFRLSWGQLLFQEAWILCHQTF